jgi:hypothetical protein
MYSVSAFSTFHARFHAAARMKKTKVVFSRGRERRRENDFFL